MSDSSLITLILPIRNEAKYIRQCLDAILGQDYPVEQMEILVADGMSTDDTRGIVEQYQENHPQIRLLDNPGKIVPTGMNIGLRQTRGEVIIRVDGHCIIAPDYVRNCVEYLEDETIAGVGGPMETIGENAVSQTIAIAMSSPFGVGNSSFRTVSGKSMLVDTVPFPAFRRETIRQVGVYDEELVRNQDDEYSYRVREFGGKLLLAADVRSRYFSRGSLKGLWKQYYQYGFYKVRVLQKHPRQMSMRQFVPPAFVLSLMAGLILTVILPWGWIPLSVIAGSYLVANLAASLVTALKKGWNHLLLLPFTFAILHLSYGLGFLCGLVKFWNRWGDKAGKVSHF